MPLTRNLYREDEVLAALRFCVLKGRGPEAIFWAQEALDSEMRDEVLESLFWVWALTAAHANPWWLRAFRTALQTGNPSDDDVITLVMNLARNLNDGSVLAILGLGLRQELWYTERVGQPPLPAFSRTISQEELFIARAITQGKILASWGRLIPLWDQGVPWDLLKELSAPAAELIHMLQTAPLWFSRLAAPKWKWPLRAAAVVLATWPLPSDTPYTPPIEWVAGRFNWLTNPMRFRRLYAPPQIALHAFTARGQLGVAQTTERDLMEHLEDSLRGSRFWDSRCPELTASDESRENFYDRYFPTDIPDEWTAVERRVSHGTGVISNPETADWELKYETTLNTWFGALTTRIWMGIAGALKGIFSATTFDETGRPEDMLEAIRKAYTEYGMPTEQKWLVPVRREILVL